MRGYQLRSQKIVLSEDVVEEACVDIARIRGYWPIRLHAGRYKSVDGKRWITGVEKGTPDYILVKPPSIFLETKGTRGQLSGDQREMILRLEKFYGLKTAEAHSPEEFIGWLDRHERSP